jgi:hypothetical protein
LIADAEEAVRTKMKDPDAAKFTDVRLCQKPKAVTGKVNGKNSYGAYAGEESFYYVDGEAVTISENPRRFNDLSKLCFSDKVLQETNAVIANATGGMDLDNMLGEAGNEPVGDDPTSPLRAY